VLPGQRRGTVTGEGWAAGEHGVQHAAQRVHVGAGVDSIAAGVLGPMYSRVPIAVAGPVSQACAANCRGAMPTVRDRCGLVGQPAAQMSLRDPCLERMRLLEASSN